jgi:DNA polymerase I-like protein with 3'-5' exonuclease and polymerase domains
MLAAYDCYGDWDFFNLGFLTERLLGRRIKSYGEIVEKHKTFLDLPLKEMRDHACQDADVALQLHTVLDNELRKRRIREQFENTTLALSLRLVEYEFEGIPVNPNKLEQLRNDLIDKIKAKKKQVERALGLKIDLDSTKGLAAALKQRLRIGGTLGSRSLSLRRLEESAISYPDVRGVVEYKRLRKELKRVESVSLTAKGNKIYPLFNQIRSPSGRLFSTDPSLFEDDGPESLKDCIDSALHGFWGDRVKAINFLQAKSEDRNLQLDRSKKRCGNLFMASHPLMKELDYNELLLSVVCGVSRPAMSRQFMLERMGVDSICHDLRMRYEMLFEWLAAFRADAGSRGYATGPKGRKYLDGLKSSSVEKRKKAADAAVKWCLDL